MIVETFKKMMRRAFPGFPGCHQLHLGEVVGLPKIGVEETLTDLFRVGYAVDVKLLNAQGNPLLLSPVLHSVPLPVPGAGDGRGFYALPELGARVLLAFANGHAHLPHIIAVYATGKAVPALNEYSMILASGDGSELQMEAGNTTLSADSLTITSNQTRSETGALVEKSTTRQTEVNGDSTEVVQGQKESVVLGASRRKSASLQEVALGDISIASGKNFDLLAIGGDAVLSASAGKVGLQNALARIQADAQGKIQLSGFGAELITVLVQLLSALLMETHSTGVGPSGPPLNAVEYAQIKTLLERLKVVLPTV